MTAAAEPILASVLWTSPLASTNAIAKPDKAATRIPEVDAILDGGLEYGQVTCISGEPENNSGEILLATLVTHLLATRANTATVIDSTLSFDVRNLLKSLQGAVDLDDGTSVGELAMAALGRVQIMKVFDFEGMSESISEVRETLERGNQLQPAAFAASPHPLPRGTIGDSEDEDDDEMLLAPSPPAEIPPSPPRKTDSSSETPPTCGLLIIDNIAQVTAPLIKNNPAQGQALLVSFMRSLHHLTRTHNLATMLMNNAVTYHQASKEESPSIYSSCILRPALGKSFAYLLDLHLLVHALPKTEQDARAIYGDERDTRKARDPETVDVVELLQDRFGRRVGRWAELSVQT